MHDTDVWTQQLCGNDMNWWWIKHISDSLLHSKYYIYKKEETPMFKAVNWLMNNNWKVYVPNYQFCISIDAVYTVLGWPVKRTKQSSEL
jgi:hypothetical protein